MNFRFRDAFCGQSVAEGVFFALHLRLNRRIFGPESWRLELNLRLLLLIQMEHEFRHVVRWRDSAGIWGGKFVMKVAALVKNGEKGREYKHRWNGQNQNSMA